MTIFYFTWPVDRNEQLFKGWPKKQIKDQEKENINEKKNINQEIMRKIEKHHMEHTRTPNEGMLPEPNSGLELKDYK